MTDTGVRILNQPQSNFQPKGKQPNTWELSRFSLTSAQLEIHPGACFHQEKRGPASHVPFLRTSRVHGNGPHLLAMLYPGSTSGLGAV